MTDSYIKSSYGAKIDFERDSKGRIVAAVDQDGNKVLYSYDKNGDLVSFTDREGNVTKFEYNSTRKHYLDKVIDPLNRSVIRNEYDALGRLTKVFDAAGNAINMSFDPENQIEVLTDPLNRSTTYEYDDRGNTIQIVDALGAVQIFEYDDDGNVTKYIDARGYESTGKTDTQGRLVSFTDALGYTTTTTYGNGGAVAQTDAMGSVTTFQYDNLGALQTMTDPRGIVSKLESQSGYPTQLSSGGVTLAKFEYDGQGRVTKATNDRGEATYYEFNSFGDMIKETFNNGTASIVTSVTYDKNKKVSRKEISSGVETIVVEYNYDAAGRLISEIIDGTEKNYEYNLANNLVGVSYADGTYERFTYDAAGQLIEEVARNGVSISYRYDLGGRVTEVRLGDNTPNDPNDNPKVSYTYDLVGNLLTETDPYGRKIEYEYDARGNKTLVKDPLGNEVRYTYDGKGRVASVTAPDGNVTKYIYNSDGLVEQVIRPDGSSTKTKIQDESRIDSATIEKTDASGKTVTYTIAKDKGITAVTTPAGRTTYDYDQNGNLVKLTDAKGQSWLYTYEEGRLVQTTLPTGDIVEYDYNTDGQLASSVDMYGGTTTYTYDGEGFLLTETRPDGTTISFNYDSNNQLESIDTAGTLEAISYTQDGQIASIVNSRGTTEFTYDELDRLVKRQESDGRFISYTYDRFGYLASVQSNGGTTLYSYDDLGNLLELVDTAGQTTKYTYNSVGMLIKSEYGNGVVETFTYNSLYHLVSIKTTKQGTTLSSFDYTRDSSGKILKVEELSGRVVSYSYDSESRLVSEFILEDGISVSRSINYTYDAVGNRLSRNDSVEGITNYTYNELNQLISSTINSQATTYSYDSEGKLIKEQLDSDTFKVYSWNLQSKVTKVVSNDNGVVDEVEYVYDRLGQLSARIENGVETRYLVDSLRPLSQVREEYDVNGNLKSVYNYTLSTTPVSQVRDGISYFYHSDNVGSVRKLTNGSGVVTDEYEYDAYGRILRKSGATTNNHLYTGEQYDEKLGLVYLRARYLQPETGRFISQDDYSGELSDPMSIHKYQYAHANPVINTDPTGYFTLTEFSATEAIQKAIRGYDTAKEIMNLYRLVAWIQALDNIIWLYSVVTEVFANYLEDFWLVGAIGSTTGISGGGTGFTGRNAGLLSKLWIWDKPKSPGAQITQGLTINGRENWIASAKKFTVSYSAGFSIPPLRSDGLTDNWATGFTWSGYVSKEEDTGGKLATGSKYSGGKWKLEGGINPLYLGGSLSQEITIGRDPQTDGKVWKFVMGSELSTKITSDYPYLKTKTKAGVYLQLSFLAEVSKLKWQPLQVELSNKTHTGTGQSRSWIGLKVLGQNVGSGSQWGDPNP
ncbi:MAG: RHS repeat-associated core domain-containing protein [Pseudanabaena sp.]